MTDEYRELVMPFTAVASNGGPFEDESFVAGWRLGSMDADLGHVGTLTAVTVREKEVEQADLIAMRHGCTTKADEPVDGWVRLEISRA